MDQLQQILDKLDQIEEMAHAILHAQPVSGGQVVVIGGLGDISDNLGLVKAGEFRSGKGEPNYGFTGVRMGSPGWTYENTTYSIVGINNDVLQFGLSNTDGKIYVGGGDVILDANGISFIDEGANIQWLSFQYNDSGTLYGLGYIAGFGFPGSLSNVTMSAYITDDSPWTNSIIWLLAKDDRTLTGPVATQIQINTNGTILVDAGTIRLRTTYLSRYIGGADYLGGIYVPKYPPLTSTSWDGDSFSTTAKTLIDLSTVFSIPIAAKAIDVAVKLNDSASSTTDCYLILSPTATADEGRYFSCTGLADDKPARAHALIPCNGDGDVYYQVAASGADTLDIVLEIYGYLV